MAVYDQPGRVGDFQHDLLSCGGSCTDCLRAYVCPNCYAFCAAQEAGEGTLKSVLNCLLYPLCICCLRGNVRESRGIDGGCCKDACVSWLCPCCAIIQIKREFTD